LLVSVKTVTVSVSVGSVKTVVNVSFASFVSVKCQDCPAPCGEGPQSTRTDTNHQSFCHARRGKGMEFPLLVQPKPEALIQFSLLEKVGSVLKEQKWQRRRNRRRGRRRNRRRGRRRNRRRGRRRNRRRGRRRNRRTGRGRGRQRQRR